MRFLEQVGPLLRPNVILRSESVHALAHLSRCTLRNICGGTFFIKKEKKMIERSPLVCYNFCIQKYRCEHAHTASSTFLCTFSHSFYPCPCLPLLIFQSGRLPRSRFFDVTRRRFVSYACASRVFFYAAVYGSLLVRIYFFTSLFGREPRAGASGGRMGVRSNPDPAYTAARWAPDAHATRSGLHNGRRCRWTTCASMLIAVNPRCTRTFCTCSLTYE